MMNIKIENDNDLKNVTVYAEKLAELLKSGHIEAKPLLKNVIEVIEAYESIHFPIK